MMKLPILFHLWWNFVHSETFSVMYRIGENKCLKASVVLQSSDTFACATRCNIDENCSGFSFKGENCSLFSLQWIQLRSDEDGTSCFVKLSDLDIISNPLKNSQIPTIKLEKTTKSSSLSEQSFTNQDSSVTSTYNDSTFKTENTDQTTETLSTVSHSSSSTSTEDSTLSGTETSTIETSTSYTSLPSQGSLLYTRKAGDSFYCPDGSVMSALGYCANISKLCSGICMALNKSSDIQLSSDCETTQTCCQWESNSVFMSVTSINESGTKGYDRTCCPLLNGWSVDTGYMTEVRDHQEPPSNVQGDQNDVPNRWLICPTNHAIRYLDLDTTQGDYYIRAIKCYKME